MFYLLLSLTIVSSVTCSGKNNTFTFPDEFLIGVASSAYQIEGAWNVSDKAASNWDHFVHRYPEKIADRSNADVTTDSYHRYHEDVNILADLGVDHYRFSISWSRILPKGHSGYVSQSALRYYHKLLDALESKGIIPFLTMYHWEHPQILEETGGWLNDSMPYLFADYARVVFRNFGHRVKYFVTLNEPSLVCSWAYAKAKFPPAHKLKGTEDYQCVHNQIKANALAYHIYDKEFRKKYNGQVGITFHCKGVFSEDEKDLESDDLAFEFECGWQAHPIFSENGDYPEIMKKKVAERSRAQGLNSSRLPSFSEFWIKQIKGTADFFGLNYYTSRLVRSLSNLSIIDWPNDEGLEYISDSNWASAQLDWLKIVPDGLNKVLRTINNKYKNPAVYITENGIADSSQRDDIVRISYVKSHLKAISSAITKNGCNVKAYTYWSLMDSFEWNSGFTPKFGLMHVDFNNVNRTRTPKKSVGWFKNFISTRKLKSFE